MLLLQIDDGKEKLLRESEISTHVTLGKQIFSYCLWQVESIQIPKCFQEEYSKLIMVSFSSSEPISLGFLSTRHSSTASTLLTRLLAEAHVGQGGWQWTGIVLDGYFLSKLTHTHTHTHTHVCFCEKWGHPIGVMVFILYELCVLLPYT